MVEMNEKEMNLKIDSKSRVVAAESNSLSEDDVDKRAHFLKILSLDWLFLKKRPRGQASELSLSSSSFPISSFTRASLKGRTLTNRISNDSSLKSTKELAIDLKKMKSRENSLNYLNYFLLFLVIFGLILVIIGLILYRSLLYTLIYRIISERLVIAKGSETYEKWKKIPMPVYYRYYFFNVTNAIEIERNGAKPVVREIGPFTYRSYWTKNPIRFNANNSTVTFRELKTLEFVPELSVASDRSKILVTVNGPLTVTLALLQKAPLVVRNIVSLGLSGVSEGFFVKRSARELLFDGYPEVLTSFGPLLNPNLPNTKGRFGWLYGRNNTDDGLFTVFTGKDDIKRINQIDRYNGLQELKFWKQNSICNKLNGATDGQIIAISNSKSKNTKNKEDESSFILFHPELCRTIKFLNDKSNLNNSFFLPNDFNGDPDDIKFTVNRFVPDPDTLSSMDDYPQNSCYLSRITPSKPELGDILVSIRQREQNQSRFQIRPFFRLKNNNNRIVFKSGVFDMSECKYGAPVLFSYPHFLHAHPNYRENIAGLKPDPNRHQFHMMIEPVTGTSIRSYARIQINIYITKPPWISRFRYVPEVVFPVFWQELRAEASQDMIEHINWALTKPFQYADLFSISIIISGILISISSAFFLIRKLRKQAIQRKLTKKQQEYEQHNLESDSNFNDDRFNSTSKENILEMVNGFRNSYLGNVNHAILPDVDDIDPNSFKNREPNQM